MNQDINNTIKRLNFENFIWIVFIVVSLLDIYGDELIKRSILQHDKNSSIRASNLFLWLTVISLIIYIYFFARNYSDYKKFKNKSYEIRFIGSIFVLIGTICFLYFQLTTRTQQDSLSNI